MRALPSITIPTELLEAIAQRVADILEERQLTRSEAPEWITLEEAADRLRLTTAAARKRAQRAQLPGAIKDGTRWLVDARQLDAPAGCEYVRPDQTRRGERRGHGPAPGTRRNP